MIVKRFGLFLWALLCCLLTANALTLPTSGGVYRIVNVKNKKVISENFTAHSLNCEDKGSSTAYNQLWKVTKTNNSYQLQNIYTKRYLKTESSNSARFYTDVTSSAVTVTEAPSKKGYLLRCGNYLHCDAGNAVVGWHDMANEASHWTFEQVASYNEAEGEKAHQEYANMDNLTNPTKVAEYTKKLESYFTDATCTVLKSEYASKTDEELKTAMNGLPDDLKAIAVKIKNNAWTGNNAGKFTDDHNLAKQFRVSKYKPYSDAATWQNKLGHHAWSYMSNPTGIYGDSKNLLYVFVGNDIPSGSTLYLAGVVDNELVNKRDYGTQLKKGLNVIVTSRDNTIYYVIYTVDTQENGKKVAEYPDLDIHIEGGRVNGYYDKTWMNDSTYAYLLSKARNNNIFVVKGTRSIFSYSKEAYTRTWPTKVYEAINWFDNVVMWEEDLMGFTTAVANGSKENSRENITGGDSLYPEYCNNLAFGFQGPDGSNPNATWWRTSYPGIGGIESSFNAYRQDFDNWCTGHEVGHQHQGLYNLESSTESSNNVFSNIVTHLTGYRMSRGASIADLNNYFQKNTVFQLRDIGLTHRMWYQLWLYYHLAGKKKDFFPTLFKLLRNDPIKLKDGHNTESGLKFVRLVCKAANEDLTDFFTVWGLLTPYQNQHFGDYRSYTCTITQADVDQVKAEIAKYPKKNTQILFIEDRIKPQQRFDIHANTTDSTKNWRPRQGGGNFQEGEWGVVGNYTDFRDGVAAPNYTYAFTGNAITMTGEGGVGFLVYDTEGNLLAISNQKTIRLTADQAAKGFVVKAMGADGTAVDLKDIAEVGSDDQKVTALQATIASAREFLGLKDDGGKKVGFYPAEQLKTLISLISTADQVIKDKNVAKYTESYKALTNEIIRLGGREAMNTLKTTSFYQIVNKRANKSIYTSGSNIYGGNSNNFSAQWLFVSAGKEGIYYLQNRQTQKYISNLTRNNATEANSTVKSGAVEFKVTPLGKGVFALQKADESTSLNYNDSQNKTIGWDIDDGSKWYITEVDVLGDASLENLKTLSKEANALVKKVATIKQLDRSLTLQTTNRNNANYLSTNQQETTEGPIANIIDNNSNTYFHSKWKDNSRTPDYHYLQVDLGSGNTMNAFSFYYTTRHNEHNVKPATIVVSGSTNGSNFFEVTTLSNLPTNNRSAESYNSGIITAKMPYRYWRFTVTHTNRNNEDSHPFFALAEFGMRNRSVDVTVQELYKKNITLTLVKEVLSNIAAAKEVIDNPNDKSDLDLFNAYSNLKKKYDELSRKETLVGITTVVVEGENQNHVIYNLSGQPVKNPIRGEVYIIDGKKVVF